MMRTQSEQTIEEGDSITSLSLSSDSRHVLVNTATDGIHNWDLHTRQLIREYRGQKQVPSPPPSHPPLPLSCRWLCPSPYPLSLPPSSLVRLRAAS